MSHRKQFEDEDDKRPTTITADSRVPIYVVGSAIFLSVIVTAEWLDLRYKVGGSVTQAQFQSWIDDARDKNPSVTWPRLPEKSREASLLPMDAEYSTNNRAFRILYDHYRRFD